jgi:hypothetical protein
MSHQFNQRFKFCPSGIRGVGNWGTQLITEKPYPNCYLINIAYDYEADFFVPWYWKYNPAQRKATQ